MDLCLEGVKGKGGVINLHCMLLWVNPLVYSELYCSHWLIIKLI